MPANTGIDTACPCRCARCLSGWLHGYPLAPRGRSWCILRGPPSLKWHECDIGENVARGEVLYRVRNATRERRHLALRAGLGGKPVADLEGTLRELKHTRALEHMRHGAASEHEAWGFEPGFVERPGEHGLPEDSDQHPQYEGYESCGVPLFGATKLTQVQITVDRVLWSHEPANPIKIRPAEVGAGSRGRRRRATPRGSAPRSGSAVPTDRSPPAPTPCSPWRSRARTR